MTLISESYSASFDINDALSDNVSVADSDNPMPMHQLVPGDDRYPGTFFRVPGRPVPGKTAWSLTP